MQQTGCGATDTIGTPQTYFTDLTATKKFKYLGCGTDSISARALSGDRQSNDQMTAENCVDFCTGKGFSIAGLEYGRECYCGNSIAPKSQPIPGVMGTCTMKCAGDPEEYCGGYAAISLYQKCDGTCENAESSATDGSSNPAPVLVVSSAAPQASSTAAVSAGYEGVASEFAPVAPAGTSATSAYDANPPAGATPVPSGTSPGVSASSTGSGSGAAAPSIPTVSSNIVLPTGWSAAGCYSDAINPRSLGSWGYYGEAITSSGCAKYCDSKGYTFAGTENGGQCFCGNELVKAESKPSTDCNLPCRGSDTEICGGPARLSVFVKKVGAGKARRAHFHRRGHYLGGLTS